MVGGVHDRLHGRLFQVSFFENPGASGIHLAVAIGLAIGFGAVWLTCYWPPLIKKPWLWAVLVSSAFLTVVAVCFIQTPLQIWTGQALMHFWSQEILMRWILLAAIPQILLTGLVQEGAKLVPVVVYWWRSGKSLDPKLGLAIGAVAGAGFAIFEAQWAHSQILTSGMDLGSSANLRLLGTGGILGEVFYRSRSHRFSPWPGMAWPGVGDGKSHLIASVLHGLLNYGAVLWQAELLTGVYVEMSILLA